MPYIIPETMPADWLVDFAIDDHTGDIADAMRAAYARVLERERLDTVMGRLKAACLAAAESAKPAVKEWPDNAAEDS